MGVKALFSKRKEQVDRKLNAVLPKENAQPKKLHKAMRYSVFSGGKRIRPILAVESCLCCGGTVTDALIPACAIELVHTFSLIHDDLPSMDNDNYRRGKLTCHKKFDEATAVLAGDSLLCLAFGILGKGTNSKSQISIIKELAYSIGSLGMAGGQAIDIEYEGKKKSPQIVKYINLHKTAFLIKASLKIGAIAAKADPRNLSAMSTYGMSIGEMFQLIDDVLDNGQSVTVLGKEGAIKKARALTTKANKSLSLFGKKSAGLKAISDYLLKRKI